jgi:serine/threonine protein kinase/tetratricopeptide (TPR) repeat protein
MVPLSMPLVTGDRLGPYTIESLLGAGGMGEVYRAADPRLNRTVALKVISQRLVGDADSRRRFEIEARAASALNHPAIVTIYDIGDTEGLSWIAMEFIEGSTLREIIAEGRVPIQRTWAIAKQLADGLAVAHARGIVHRDLKPDNVMLTHDGRVKILDFGLARSAPAFGAESTAATIANAAATAQGVILGTVGYMSPEQAAGRNTDFRSDQFSFGAVVYELLAGEKAFARPTAVETLSAIIRDHPPALPSIRRDVSQAFARVVTKCLEKQPEQRFESTRELATALEALTPESSEQEIATPAPPRPAEILKPSASRQLRWMIAGALAIAVVAFGPLLWNRSGGADRTAITSLAVLPFENTAADPEIEYIADGVTDSLIDHLSRARSLKVMARATVMRLKGQDPRQAAEALGVAAIVTGTVAKRGSEIAIAAELIERTTGQRLWGQTFERPVGDLMRVQDSIVLSIVEGLQLRLSGEERARLGGFGTSNPEAYELFLKGRFLLESDTEEDELAARKLFMQAVQKDPNFVDAYMALSSSYARGAGSGYEPPGEALALARQAIAKAAALDPGNGAVRAAMAHQRFQTTRDWAATEREYRALMHDPGVLRSVQYHPISLFFVAIGRPDEAVAIVERALEVDPGNLESRVMLGNFLLQAGRLADAQRVYDQIAVEVPNDPRPLFGAADVQRRRGRFAQAAVARRKAHELSGDEEAAAAFTGVTTEAEYAKADIAVARMQLRDLEMLGTQRYVQPFDIARAHAQVGNREQALTGLEQAVEGEYIGLSLLKVDQAWDSVRDDPRFAAIVRRVGIP